MDADTFCESLIKDNSNSYDLIKRNVTREDLRKWTETLKGLQPIHSKKESLDSWLTRYKARISQIIELNNRIQAMAELAHVNRTFVICSLRMLQKEYGYDINFNMFKDSAIRKIIKHKRDIGY